MPTMVRAVLCNPPITRYRLSSMIIQVAGFSTSGSRHGRRSIEWGPWFGVGVRGLVFGAEESRGCGGLYRTVDVHMTGEEFRA